MESRASIFRTPCPLSRISITPPPCKHQSSSWMVSNYWAPSNPIKSRPSTACPRKSVNGLSQNSESTNLQVTTSYDPVLRRKSTSEVPRSILRLGSAPVIRQRNVQVDQHNEAAVELDTKSFRSSHCTSKSIRSSSDKMRPHLKSLSGWVSEKFVCSSQSSTILAQDHGYLENDWPTSAIVSSADIDEASQLGRGNQSIVNLDLYEAMHVPKVLGHNDSNTKTYDGDVGTHDGCPFDVSGFTIIRIPSAANYSETTSSASRSSSPIAVPFLIKYRDEKPGRLCKDQDDACAAEKESYYLPSSHHKTTKKAARKHSRAGKRRKHHSLTINTNVDLDDLGMHDVNTPTTQFDRNLSSRPASCRLLSARPASSAALLQDDTQPAKSAEEIRIDEQLAEVSRLASEPLDFGAFTSEKLDIEWKLLEIELAEIAARILGPSSGSSVNEGEEKKNVDGDNHLSEVKSMLELQKLELHEVYLLQEQKIQDEEKRILEELEVISQERLTDQITAKKENWSLQKKIDVAQQRFIDACEMEESTRTMLHKTQTDAKREREARRLKTAEQRHEQAAARRAAKLLKLEKAFEVEMEIIESVIGPDERRRREDEEWERRAHDDYMEERRLQEEDRLEEISSKAREEIYSEQDKQEEFDLLCGLTYARQAAERQKAVLLDLQLSHTEMEERKHAKFVEQKCRLEEQHQQLIGEDSMRKTEAQSKLSEIRQMYKEALHEIISELERRKEKAIKKRNEQLNYLQHIEMLRIEQDGFTRPWVFSYSTSKQRLQTSEKTKKKHNYAISVRPQTAQSQRCRISFKEKAIECQ